MADEVFVPYGDSAQETATLLLAAAEKSKADPGVVRSSSDGGFYVPEEVAEKAKVDYEDEAPGLPEAQSTEDEKPAKKAAAKKAAAKK